MPREGPALGAAALLVVLVGACGGGRATGRDAGPDADAGGLDLAAQDSVGDAGTDLAGDAGTDLADDVPLTDAGAADADGGACDPDARPQPNVGLVEAPGQGGCPAGMIQIPVTAPFCIDRYEAALVLATDGSPWSPYFNPGTTAVRAVSIAGAIPQAYVSSVQAAAACAAAGKRLCTDAEWLRACRGAPSTTYPYGDTRQPGVCNDARATNPVVEYFGSSDPSVFAMGGHPCIDQLPSSLAPTGGRAGCVTTDGAFDMMGNLNEWTADPAGTFRGGDYVNTMINGEGCLYLTTAHDTSFWDYSTGFRCCF
jgi:sulfatase modifying factor 1